MRNKCRNFAEHQKDCKSCLIDIAVGLSTGATKSYIRLRGIFFGTNLKSLGSPVTNYEAVNGGAKCRIWGSLGRLRGTQGHGQCHYSIERIRLPIQL